MEEKIEFPLEFGINGKLTDKGKLNYAKNIFKHNLIRKCEVEAYKGNHNGTKGGDWHNIPNNIWKEAYLWAVKTNNFKINE